jgi:hypothetical protein
LGSQPCNFGRHTAENRSANSRENFEKGSVESTHKVPTSHYHAKHCHAVVASLGGLEHTGEEFQGSGPHPPSRPRYIYRPPADSSRDRPPMPPKKKEPATGAHCSLLKGVCPMVTPPLLNVLWRVWRSTCNSCLLAFPRAIREREAVCVSTDVTRCHRHRHRRCCYRRDHRHPDRPRNRNRLRSGRQEVSLPLAEDTRVCPYMRG